MAQVISIDEPESNLWNVGVKTLADLAGENTDEGSWIVGWQKNDGVQQKWIFSPLPGSGLRQYNIRSSSNKSGTSYASAASDNFVVGSKTPKGWIIERPDDGPVSPADSYSIIDPDSGLAWTLVSAENKTRIQLLPRDTASANQVWRKSHAN